MYLSDSEEIVAFIVALVIVMGFVASTYMEIKNTIAEEKERIAEKHKNEEKIKMAGKARAGSQPEFTVRSKDT